MRDLQLDYIPEEPLKLLLVKFISGFCLSAYLLSSSAFFIAFNGPDVSHYVCRTRGGDKDGSSSTAASVKLIEIVGFMHRRFSASLCSW